MNKLLLSFAFISLALSVSKAQITTTKVAPIEKNNTTLSYDSTANFLGDSPEGYIGQELYLKGLSEGSRKYGYRGFLIDHRKSGLDDNNIYKCCDSHNSKYSEMEGKYFTVTEIYPHPLNFENKVLFGSKRFFELKEKESGVKVYYEYDGKYDHSFPFLTVGFFVKSKAMAIGRSYVFNKIFLGGSTDISTGKLVTNTVGQKWKCTDLTIDEKYYTLSLVLQNDLNEKTMISYDAVYGDSRFSRVFYEAEVKDYTKRFGVATFNNLLRGALSIGMTEEMCRISWGKPKNINSTITAGATSEQWVYNGSYLYFKNGKLTAIQ